MSSSSPQQNRGLKRKKPPTFQHLPVQRAKKLKRSWVQVQKIKSKWKAQKRKEGLVASRYQLERSVGVGADEPNDRESGEDPTDEEENELPSGPSDRSAGRAAHQQSGDEAADSDSESEGSSADEKTGTFNAKSASPKGSNLPKSARSGTQRSVDEQPSLRDLQRMAYSRASLHTQNSDPLHRHRGFAPSRGRGGRGGDRGGGRGGSRGSEPRGRGGIQRGRGRGQPDMGLRMKAILEKIKQDFT